MTANIVELKQEYARRAGELELKVQVPCDGVFLSDTAIIAEAPGEREVVMKRPLIGGSGKLLWTELRKYADLQRNHVFVTNVVRRQLLFDDRKSGVPSAELDHWIALLKWELTQLPNLKYVVLLGNYAMHAVLGHEGITQWRGSVVKTDLAWWDGTAPGSIEYDDEGRPTGELTHVRRKKLTTICINNPAAVIRSPSLTPVFRMDVAKIRSIRDGSFKEHTIDEYINPSPSQAVAWCDRMHDERLPIAFDIEVISNETACIGLANNTHEGMCINFRNIGENRWSLMDERQVRKRLNTLLSDDSVRLVAQNGNFDAYWLWYKDRIRCAPIWFDTMLAHHVLYPLLPHNLGFLCAQYTTHPFYKDESKEWREGGDIDTFWRYNVKDICITRAAQQGLERELRDQAMEPLYFNHVMRLQPHLIRATVAGILADRERKDQIAADLSEEVAQILAEINAAASDAVGEEISINPSSPKQMADLYFRRLRLVGKGTKTDKTNRRYMRDYPRTTEQQRTILDLVDRYAEEKKFLGTYAEMKVDPDDRIRCEYKQTGVASAPGRLSSASVMWGSGTNLQNQPERAYQMYLADEGYVYIYFDLSQAEARAVACFAEIYEWLEQFERARLDGSYDCHRALASQMFGMLYHDVTTSDRDASGNPTIRFIAKRCRHGLNYRMGPPRLAETTGLPMREAEAHYHTYHRITPELKEWWGRLEREVKQTRQLTTPFGRRLLFMSRIDDEAMKSIVAFKPQSTIGDKVSQVWYQCEDDHRWPTDARICMNIHDALIGLAPASKAMTCLSIMKHYAEKPLMMNNIEMIIPAETKMSVPGDDGRHRWSTLKPVEVEACH